MRTHFGTVEYTHRRSAADREKCARVGFRGHIAKPYDTAALVGEVAAALARS